MVIGILDDIFHDLQETKKILLDNEILQDSRICEKCGNSSSIKILKIGPRYKISSSKLERKKALHAIYLLLLDVDYKQLFLAHGLSSAPISKIKKKFYNFVLFTCKKGKYSLVN
ncbi:hypothetical protein HZS_3250 [Henneguya salminicola]|nr:hypothetical protein HZS_3250 [Henneguya salminicola]